SLLDDADQQPAPEGAEDAAEPAKHDARIHDDDEIEPGIGLKGLRAGDQAAGDRGDADAEAPGEAMRAIDVDPHIDRRAGIVGGGAQRLAEPRMAEEQVDRAGHQHSDDEADAARAVEQYLADLPRPMRQRRADRLRGRTENNQR